MPDPFIKPWSKQSNKILHDLMHNGRIQIHDNGLPRSFGARCPKLIDEGYLEILWSKKKRKTWFVTPPDVVMIPKRGRYYFFKRY